MSLVQRVTSIEGTDREPPSQYGTVKSIRRVISYDAFPPKPDEQPQHPPAQPHGGVAPYKVSTARRLAQVAVTVLACWLASGIVFGFAALKPVLVDVGVYRNLCTEFDIQDDADTCYEQDLRLNLFFAVASTTCNVSALPVGTILDRFGPRVAAMIGCVSLAIGSLLMAFAFWIPEFDGYIVGNVFLALGGTFIFVPSFSIANAFPKFSGLIVATVTGAFDASAAVFLFYRIAYEQSGGAFIPHYFFFGFLVVPILIFVAQLTLFDADSYKTVPQLEQKIEKERDATRDVHDSDDELSDNEVRRLRSRRKVRRESKLQEIDHLLGDKRERMRRDLKEEARQHTSGVWGALHGKSALEQMLTPWFVLITLLTVLQMLRMNFFIATIQSQYEYMLGSENAARSINHFFDVALPVGGVAATPFIGLLLDSVSVASVLAILVAIITAIGVLGSLPFLWAGYANVILFVLLRPLYYSAMSDYAAKVFGFATFGRVYGTIICFSGLVNLFQPAIDAMIHDVYHNNPIPVNAFLAGLGLLFGVVLVAFVIVQGKKVRKQQDEEDAEMEQSMLASVMEDESEYGTF